MIRTFAALAFVTGFTIANLGATTISVIESEKDMKDSAGNFVGPYMGFVNGEKNPYIYCDDLDNHITFGEEVRVNVSTIKDLSLTRFGTVKAATELYEQAFYLSTFLGNPKNNDDRADIQDALWSYFSENAPNREKEQVKKWLEQAKANYAGKDYSGFVVYTDSGDQFHGKQELFTGSIPAPPVVTATPEPATWTLLLTGFGGLVVAGAKKSCSRG